MLQLLDRETRREKVIEAKNREQRLKMKTLKMHDESDFVDASSKLDEREDVKESSGSLRNALIAQCEQEYENMINTVNRSFLRQSQLKSRKIHISKLQLLQELTRQMEANNVELNNNVMQNDAVIS